MTHPAQHHVSLSVALLDADPDLGQLLSEERLAEARRSLVARRRAIPAGPWAGDRLSDAASDNVGLLILNGLIAKEVAIADHVSCHLVGPGDLVRPWLRSDPGRLLRAESRWTALAPTEVAVLDRRVGAMLGRYPEVNAVLVDRLSEQIHRISIAQAVSQLVGVDRRVLALFWHLAERWGRVGPQGILVPIPIGHSVLAGLVGARRPTVSTALGKLASAGDLRRLSDGTWLLPGEPVGQPTGEAARIVRRRRRPDARHREEITVLQEQTSSLREALELERARVCRRGSPADDALNGSGRLPETESALTAVSKGHGVAPVAGSIRDVAAI